MLQSRGSKLKILPLTKFTNPKLETDFYYSSFCELTEIIRIIVAAKGLKRLTPTLLTATLYNNGCG